MIVIYRNDNSDLNQLFRKEIEFNVPYVETQVGLVSMSLWRKIDPNTRFYFPEIWKDNLTDLKEVNFYKRLEDITIPKGEISIYTGLFLMPQTLDTSVLLQNPEETFALGNILYAGANNHDVLSLIRKKKAPDREFMSFEYLETANYLRSMLEVLPESSVSFENGSTILGGAAFINSENIVDSKIYGPCYISEGSFIANSVIYPGSIIINSNIVKSEVRESYVYNSKLEESTIQESLVVSSRLTRAHIKESEVPAGSLLTGGSHQ